MHQQVVDHHARIAEAVDQLVGKHHAVHPPERVVRCEKITAFGIEFFEPFDRIGHSPELKTSLDKLLRRKRGILIQNIVDFVLMDRALEPADNESRHPSGDPAERFSERRAAWNSRRRKASRRARRSAASTASTSIFGIT